MKLGHAIFAGVAIAAAAFAAGWLAHRPPQPQLELHDLRGYESDGADQVHVVQTSGPVRVVTRTMTKPAPGCVGPEVEQVVTEDRGQVVTDTQREDEQHVVEVERTDLKVTPALPARSLLLGAQVWPERRAALGGALRLPELPFVGAWWVQGETVIRPDAPLSSSVVLFLRKDF